jgi:hypothetical protein
LFRWWYRTLEDSELWWMTRRARMEGAAIEVWLQQKQEVENVEGWRGLFDIGDIVESGELVRRMRFLREYVFYSGWCGTEAPRVVEEGLVC